MDELTLMRDTPVEIDPTTVGASGVTMVIQNTMHSEDDVLYVSRNGGTTRTWMEVLAGDSVKFATPIWVKQTGKHQWIFPVYEIS
jgi:hypothetical protein